MTSFSGRQPSRTAFIGNLPYGVSEEALMDICTEAGPVKFFRLVSDLKTGEPKGFAFCEYFDVASVQSAIRLLNNREVLGRKIRLDYASDQAITGTEGKPGIIRQAGNSQAVGMDAAKTAAQNMHMLLPGSMSTSASPNHTDTITSIIAGMSRPDLYAILSQVKTLIQQDPKQVRTLLTAQPNLARALFQAQVALGMLPLPQTNGSTAPAPGSSLGPSQQPAPSLLGQPQNVGPNPGGFGISLGVPYQQQSQPMGPTQGQAPVSDPRSNPRRQFQQMPHAPGMEGGQFQQAFSGHQSGQPSHMPSQASQPSLTQASQQQPQPHQQSQQLPAQMQQAQQQPAQQQQPQQSPQPQFGLAQQQALLQQVMNLTPAQIDLLPEQQKQQVLTLQKQMRGQRS